MYKYILAPEFFHFFIFLHVFWAFHILILNFIYFAFQPLKF